MAKKKRGRPPKHGERLSKIRAFRVRGKLDELLADSAETAGRSISEEIEARLQLSYLSDAYTSTAIITREAFAQAVERARKERDEALELAARDSDLVRAFRESHDQAAKAMQASAPPWAAIIERLDEILRILKSEANK